MAPGSRSGRGARSSPRSLPQDPAPSFRQDPHGEFCSSPAWEFGPRGVNNPFQWNTQGTKNNNNKQANQKPKKPESANESSDSALPAAARRTGPAPASAGDAAESALARGVEAFLTAPFPLKNH